MSETVTPEASAVAIGQPTVEPELSARIIQSYEGDLVDGHLQHGKGRAIFTGGNTFEGSWELGAMQGHGVYTWASDGLTFEGDFKRNAVSGKGRYSWPDGSDYSGEVQNGLRHGVGTHQCSAGSASRYEGEWSRGKRHGRGTQFYDAERSCTYVGTWVEGERHGSGVMQYPNGNRYEGEWKNNKKHGTGTMDWFDRRERYKGDWAGGLQNGRGQHVWIDVSGKGTSGTQTLMCNHYVGEWRDGMRHGRGRLSSCHPSSPQSPFPRMHENCRYLCRCTGVFFYANGARYEGEWLRNKKHGHGTYIFEDGRVYEGEFVADRMTGPTPPKSEDDKGSIKIEFELDDIIAADPRAAPLALDARRAKREVENTLLRWNTDLKRLYAVLSQRSSGPTDPATFESTMFTMNTAQLWGFARSCGITDSSLTLAHIDRILHLIRCKHRRASSAPVPAPTPEAVDKVETPFEGKVEVPETAEESPETTSESNGDDVSTVEAREGCKRGCAVDGTLDDGDLHDGSRPVLFREFVEALVRVADVKYRDALPMSLASRLSRLLHSNVQSYHGNDSNVAAPATLPMDLRSPVRAVLDRRSEVVSTLYASCTSEANGPNDRTASTRALLSALKKRGLVSSTGEGQRTLTLAMRSALAHFVPPPSEQSLNQSEERENVSLSVWGTDVVAELLDVEMLRPEFEHALVCALVSEPMIQLKELDTSLLALSVAA